MSKAGPESGSLRQLGGGGMFGGSGYPNWEVSRVNRLKHQRIRYTTRSVLFFGMVFGITACASSGSSVGSGSGSPNSITRTQIEAVPGGSALTVIQQLRPRWLRSRSQGTLSSPGPLYAVVFLDGRRWGPIDTLFQISSSEMEGMEYLNARDATTLYGTGYFGGIISITLRRGDRVPLLGST